MHFFKLKVNFNEHIRRQIKLHPNAGPPESRLQGPHSRSLLPREVPSVAPPLISSGAEVTLGLSGASVRLV